MAGACVPVVRIQAADFDLAAEIARLTAGQIRCRRGGHLFGPVPRRGRQARRHSSSSTIRAWPRPRLHASPRKRSRRWPLLGLTAIHRHGKIMPGENIVLVVAASAHRQAAFEAASFLMDFLKSRAPFWKKEHRADGSAGDWVDAKDADEAAAARWKRSSLHASSRASSRKPAVKHECRLFGGFREFENRVP